MYYGLSIISWECIPSTHVEVLLLVYSVLSISFLKLSHTNKNAILLTAAYRTT